MKIPIPFFGWFEIEEERAVMWNYRLVQMTDEDDEPCMEVREVYYDRQGKPAGHCRATVSGETIDEIQQMLNWIREDALENPVLRKEDFTGSFPEMDKNEEH